MHRQVPATSHIEVERVVLDHIGDAESIRLHLTPPVPIKILGRQLRGRQIPMRRVGVCRIGEDCGFVLVRLERKAEPWIELAVEY